MFYFIFLIILIILLTIYNHHKDNKLLKILTIIYCTITFLITIFLPDAYVISYEDNELTHSFKDTIYALIRWFSSINFIILPISVFYNNKIIKSLAHYFSLPITIISILFYPVHLEYYTSPLGRGLNSIDMISTSFKQLLLNPILRTIIQLIVWLLELTIIINIKNYKLEKKETKKFILTLLFIIFSSVPIYVPQHLFGYTNIIFDKWTIPHILWLLTILLIIIILNKIFKNKSKESKEVLCMILSLSLFIQYNQMFTAISMNIKRLPLQLCNIGAYLILISLITKNKKIFNFTLIVNVIGVLFALLMPDLDGKGLFYLYNMHFIFEHTNILIIPILALSLRLFPKLDKKSLKDCLLGFTIYFITVLLLGTLFNGLALITNNSFYEANYLFMFDKEVATTFFKPFGLLFNKQIQIGHFIFYPLIQSTIYLTFITLCILLYFIIKLIYKICKV